MNHRILVLLLATVAPLSSAAGNLLGGVVLEAAMAAGGPGATTGAAPPRPVNAAVANLLGGAAAVTGPPEGASPAKERTLGLLLKDEMRSSDGYTLFSPMLSASTYLIDHWGRMVHSWDTELLPGQLAYLLEDGSLMRAGAPQRSTPSVFQVNGIGGEIQRFSWDGDLIWEASYDSDDYVAHHDFAVLPSGNVLMLAWEHKDREEAIAAGRDPSLLTAGAMYPDHLVEIQPDESGLGGEIVWEWHAWDHLVQDFDSTKDNFGTVVDHPELIDINYESVGPGAVPIEEDWTHVNGIDYHPGLDQVMLSVREFSEVWVIDHSTTTEEAAGHRGGRGGKGGDLLYRWGNPQTYRRGTEDDRKLFYQHDAQWITDGLPGAGNIIVFNNGWSRAEGDYSSVDEIVPPVDGLGAYSLEPGLAYGPNEPHWTYASTERDFFAPFMSGAKRLPNGNTLITDAPTGTFFEVTAEGAEVWRYANPVGQDGPLFQGELALEIPNFGATTNAVFQALSYAPDYPGLLGRDLTPVGPIELY